MPPLHLPKTIENPALNRINRRAFCNLSASLAGLAVLSKSALAQTTPSSVPQEPASFLTLADAEALARQVMSPATFGYVSGGAADEITLRRNVERYAAILLNARVLVDLQALDLSVSLLGRRLPSPILFAPTASNGAIHPSGEIAVAEAAGRTGTTYVLSTSSNTPVEDVARAATHPFWFQLYVSRDVAAAMDLIRRAEAAGCEALCITVDSPVPGIRDRQARAGFDARAGGLIYPHLDAPARPPAPSAGERPSSKNLIWSDVETLIAHARVPVFLKGIMHAEDALLALKAGAAGIIVSNHGGRNLDTVPATIEVLPEIVSAVAGRAPVLVDGGIRRGTDVAKAIALGASAVLIGRPYLYGLAVGGAEGVVRVQKILLEELRQTLALLGKPSVAALDRSIIRKR
jgi:4-hydroxymandelate oxidase